MFKLIKKLYGKLLQILSVDVDDLVNYIFSNESLPAPLKSDEEELYVKMLDTQNELARSKLIAHNLRLVLYIAKRFESKKIDLEDLVSVGVIGLVKAVDSFKLDKNIKLATYASRCIENEILMFLRKVNRTQNEISLDEPVNVDDEGSELMIADIIPSPDETYDIVELKDDKKYLLTTLSTLDDRERQIIALRYGLDGQEELTQKEVADLLQISQSYISRLEKKILKKLKISMGG